MVGGVPVGLWVVSCLVMVLLAHRLPPGLLRQVAEFLPACVDRRPTAARAPRRAAPGQGRAAGRVVWVVSPIDLLPEFLPVIGPLDDVVAVVLLLRYAARSIPRETLLDAWPTDPALLLRLLGERPATDPVLATASALARGRLVGAARRVKRLGRRPRHQKLLPIA